MKWIFLSLLTLAVTVSCSKEDSSAGVPGDGLIRITASIAGTYARQTPQAARTVSKASPQTRGIVLGSEAQTGLVLLRQDDASATAPTSFAGAAYITADRATDGTLSNFSTLQTYALDDRNAWFVGFHPAGVQGSDETSWTIPAGGTLDILLTADAWSAGRYTAPVTTGMTFGHALALLQVNCTVDAILPLDVVQTSWGKITNIELLETATTATYTYADRKMTFTNSTALALSQADCQTAFDAVTLDATTQLCAGGIFAPATSGTAPLKLKIYSETKPSGVEVAVQLRNGAAAKGFEAGMTHTVTLVFDAVSVRVAATASTTDWELNGNITGDIGQNTPSAKTYPYVQDGKILVSKDSEGMATLPIHPNWTAATMPRHNDKSLDNAVAARFEVAQSDCNTSNAPGSAPASGNQYSWENALDACSKYRQSSGGAGQWRLMTKTEFEKLFPFIEWNTTSALTGVDAFIGSDHGFYWLATENSGDADQAFLGNTLYYLITRSKTLTSPFYVRCVRDF